VGVSSSYPPAAQSFKKALTRLGAANADVFTLMKIAGHSTVSVSQRYVHPTAETMEAAMERLQALNQRARLKSQTPKSQPAATPATTLDESVPPLVS